MTEEEKAGASLDIRRFAASEAGAWSNAYIVSGASEAVLFDVPMLRSDAAKLAELIDRSGKRLKAIFISHAHPDHFLASDLIADRFPAARFLSTANVVADIEADGPWMLSMLQGRLGGEGPKRLVVPDILAPPALQIDAAILDVVEFGEGEAKHIATVHIPEQKALLSADIVYHDAHLYLQERHIESWLARLSELEGFAENHVPTLYPGHGEPAGLELIARTREYLQTFVEVVKNGDAKSVEQGMLSAYPNYHARQFLTAFSIPAYFPAKP
jgi:glyoxylase-like metal-dependent hydrolase (beta-lactamase superfamily II)